MRRLHLTLTIAWFVMMPVAFYTGWIYSVAFVSACSIYANAAGHWGAFQGKQAQEEAKD